MNQALIREIGRTPRLEILNVLKRTKGLSVNEMVDKLQMSYMGIKQHCLTLEGGGFVETGRRPQKMGRPEMVYRLTHRSHELFPCESHRFTVELLEVIRDVYGPAAPDKLLFSLFERKTALLKPKIKGSTAAERAKWLVRLRNEEGYMSDLVPAGDDGVFQIVEHHSPILNLHAAHPIIGRLEQQMFEGLLERRVTRKEWQEAGLFECRFYFS